MSVTRRMQQQLRFLRVFGLLLLGLNIVVWPGGAAQAARLSASTADSYARSVVQATSVTVRISPATTAVLTGAEFAIDVVIVAGAQQVNAADVHLQFDPAYLAVTRPPATGQFLTAVAKYAYDNTTGTLSFGAYRPSGSTSGTFAVCTAYFRALQPTNTTLVSYAQNPWVVSPAHQPYDTSLQNGTVVITDPTPTPTHTWTPSPTPTQTSTPTAIPGNLCLAVYDDVNRNQVYEPASELRLPGALVTVAEDSGSTIVSFTTNGIDEPRCFPLPPDRLYTVSVVSPPSYVALGPQIAYVSLASGARLDVAFAQVLVSTSTATSTATSTRTTTPSATPTPTRVVTPIPTTISAQISPATGGNLTSPDLRVAVQVPPGAVSQTVTLTLSYLDYGPSMPWNSWDGCLLAAGRALLFRATAADGSTIVDWALPATLTVCFGPGGNVGDLALYRWDNGSGRWALESTAWDASGHCVQTQTTHLGLLVVARPDGCVRLPFLVNSSAS